MPKIRNEIATIEGWATTHLFIALGIGVVIGVIIGLIVHG